MLTHSIAFSTDNASDFFHQFPAKPAVFVLRGIDQPAEPYVAKTTNLRKRLLRLLSPPESQSKRLNLRERVGQIEYSLTGSDFESTLLLYKSLRKEFSESYQKRLRLRSAPVIRFNLDNPYPRAYVTTRIGRLTGRSVYYGPFRSRLIAEKFLNDSLDLFKIRRCTFELHPDPAFPGCVYSEMKMCLAPCFKGCTDEAYMAEVERVRSYFESGGESLVQELQAERDRLSADLDFEGAARQHEKVTKVKGIVSACDEIYRRLDHIDAILVQPSAEPRSVALFRFSQGSHTGPVHLAMETDDTGEARDESQPIEARLREAVEKLVSAGARSLQQFSEELAILRRWYYRSHKTGEIFFANHQGTLPMRRIANSLVRVHQGVKETVIQSPEQPAQG
ncbi:MAG TPA: hypothetical protein VHA33_24795 [Candidatus Angelobacter sp.]|nr:hypothetical protein [Candidatus Angelobacter sp.]